MEKWMGRRRGYNLHLLSCEYMNSLHTGQKPFYFDARETSLTTPPSHLEVPFHENNLIILISWHYNEKTDRSELTKYMHINKTPLLHARYWHLILSSIWNEICTRKEKFESSCCLLEDTAVLVAKAANLLTCWAIPLRTINRQQRFALFSNMFFNSKSQWFCNSGFTHI